MTIGEAFAGAKIAFEMAVGLKAAVDKIDDIAVKMKMAELMEALVDAKTEASLMKGRIADLEEQLSVKNNMTYDGTSYWAGADKKDGPYCQQCVDQSNKAIRLQKANMPGTWQCLTCNGYYQDDTYNGNALDEEIDDLHQKLLDSHKNP